MCSNTEQWPNQEQEGDSVNRLNGDLLGVKGKQVMASQPKCESRDAQSHRKRKWGYAGRLCSNRS